jgi:hypothetical protein
MCTHSPQSAGASPSLAYSQGYFSPVEVPSPLRVGNPLAPLVLAYRRVNPPLPSPCALSRVLRIAPCRGKPLLRRLSSVGLPLNRRSPLVI